MTEAEKLTNTGSWVWRMPDRKAAKGPGETATASATVNVNNAIQSNLQLSPAEIHPKRVEDNVISESVLGAQGAIRPLRFN